MPLNALLPYFGCKRQLAGRVVEAIGDHTAYFEPFCGSLAVLLAKPKARMEVVNDLHKGVVNLAKVVQHDGLAPQLFDRLSRTMFSEWLYKDAETWMQSHEADSEDAMRPYGEEIMPCLDWAYHYFVMSWMARNGFAGSQKELALGLAKRFTSTGGDPATRFRNVVENIPAWWERLRGVTVLCEDGLSLLDRVEDRAGTAVYCDPPYLVKGLKYKHDFTATEHVVLAARLDRFAKTRVVVSYYDHPDLAKLYPPDKWAYARPHVQHNISAAADGGSTAQEVILTSRNSA